MNESPSQEKQVPAVDEITLIDVLVAFAKRKKLVLGLPMLFAACVGFAGLSFPDIYKATTKFLPTQQRQSSAVAMLSQLGGLCRNNAWSLEH